MGHPLYPYWPLPERPSLEWPDGKRLAFYVGLNIEHFHIGRPSTAIFPPTASLEIDPLNQGWRDYGTRVGIWRVADLLDEYGVRASVLLNSEVCDEYPQIIEAGNAREWAWCGHGHTNSQMWTGLGEDEEREAIASVVDSVERGTGRRPKGWLAPVLTETPKTPALLAEQGFTYLLDWCCDDQPFPVHPDVGRMISLPYAIEVNDIVAFLGMGLTPEAFADMIIDQFDVLHQEAGRGIGAVMSVAIHPFIVGQPFRAKYLEKAIAHICRHDDVWVTTTDDIADWYFANYYEEALARSSSSAGQS